MLMAPLVRRSWAPRGQTPILRQRGAHHRKVSVIGALCVAPARDQLRFYFRLHPNADIQSRDVIRFLRHLGKELRAPWLLLWDRLNAHRAKRTQQYVAEQPALRAFYFPGYAPELNPVEYAWSNWKGSRMANLAKFEVPELADATRRHGRSLQRCPALLRSFVNHSPLSLRLT
jgi:transposase